MESQLIISILLLFISALFCAMLFLFSLAERQDRFFRPLIILIGILVIWYLALIPVQVGLVGPFLRQAHNGRPLPYFGLIRPGLLLVFAAIAHCYIIIARHRKAIMPLWIKPARIYLYSFIATAIMRLGMPDHLNSRSIAIAAASIGLIFPLSAIVISYSALSGMEKQKAGSNISEKILARFSWPVAFSISLILIIAALLASLYSTVMGEPRPSVYNAYAVISALPLIFWLIYYHTPYLFVDVFAKRGLQAILFALLFGGYYGVMLYLGECLGDRPLAVYLSIAIAVSLPAGMVVRLQGRLDRFIDKHLLGRAHYQDLLVTLNSKLNGVANDEVAIAVSCESIKQALGSTIVTFYIDNAVVANGNGNGSNLSIVVSTSDKPFGTLAIGSPLNRTRYMSEDIKFVQLVADSLAATLARLLLQKEREEQKLREVELVSTATQLRLKALQAQLDPHFLFNSMNLIGSLVRTAPDKARSAVQHLSSVYRYVLDSSRRDLVSVADEIQFLRAYLDIEQLRFESRLKVNFDLCDKLESSTIPPMLLQPLVENAIKHGLSPKIEGGTITIKIARDEDFLSFTISDTGAGFDKAKIKESKSGIGLSNLEQQLAIRYNVKLDVQSFPKQGTEVNFKLPLKLREELQSVHSSSDSR